MCPQASKHPFVTGEPFTCPYKPPPETPRLVSGSIHCTFRGALLVSWLIIQHGEFILKKICSA